ncbi:hypothetical protein [Flammeovirga pacifica]|uniref:Uncharacterized protein n=1 Tax=Flammeovirga pacifica TaxID=915059 RepID=A0A1S1Z038_FLAPC|nr:hypothetical protein [Flammeovirga pacifica]OHX66636.1 hypothetical protein NH26_09830 [Flammeovirga pacifica]
MKHFISLFTLLLLSNFIFAQEEIDASKPTNFYTQLYNHLEYNYSKNGADTYGYRAEFMFAPSEAHLILAEMPLLHNTETGKTGIGDFRARYFYLPYKNYDKFFGAFGPSVDIFAPTGNYDHGLGSGTWLIQPGVTVGLMIADWIQMFPILSYQYTSSPVLERPGLFQDSQHGMSFQIITPIILSEKMFLQVTPIYTASNIGMERNDRYIQEFIAQYALSDKLQLSGFYRGVFKDDNHTARLALVVFL